MNKKIVKRSGTFFVVLLCSLLVLCVAALGLGVLSQIIPESNVGAYIIPVAGEIFLPLQLMLGEGNQAGGMILICISAAILVLCILGIVSVTKAKKKTKGAWYVLSLILGFLFFAFFTFNIVILIIFFEPVYVMVGVIAAELIPALSAEVVAGVVMGKFIIVCALTIISAIIMFLVYIFNRDKTQRDIIKQIYNVNFYSDEYEQKDSGGIKTPEVVEKVEDKNEELKPKTKKQAQDLVTKIMQLNELKDTGQITEVEYTKLRQKAIKRYKS